jgi:hypothetical protein
VMVLDVPSSQLAPPSVEVRGCQATIARQPDVEGPSARSGRRACQGWRPRHPKLELAPANFEGHACRGTSIGTPGLGARGGSLASRGTQPIDPRFPRIRGSDAAQGRVWRVHGGRGSLRLARRGRPPRPRRERANGGRRGRAPASRCPQPPGRVDAYAERLRREMPGPSWKRSDVVRLLLAKALDAAEPTKKGKR